MLIKVNKSFEVRCCEYVNYNYVSYAIGYVGNNNVWKICRVGRGQKSIEIIENKPKISITTNEDMINERLCI
jgi:hypothetical protein